MAGKNSIAVEVLRELINRNNGRYELCVTCNKNETGEDGWQPSLRLFAGNHGIREVSLEELYETESLIFLSMEYDRIILPDKFKSSQLYNIHFSLLPAYKGMYTSAIPILNGEEQTGVTFHRIDRGIDTGDIIAQRVIPIEDMDTSRSLYFKYIDQGTRLVKEYLEQVICGTCKGVPQKAKGSTYYSKSFIDYSNIIIDCRNTAEQIRRQIRAYYFPEFQIPKVYGREIVSAEIRTCRSEKAPGTILCENAEHMIVATVDFDICMYKKGQ